MQALIDLTVQWRLLSEKQTPASISKIRKYLDDVYDAAQHENNQRDKSYSGIRARVISTAVNLMCQAYQNYLLNIEILNSKFFILVRDVIARSFNETRHELVAEEEKKLLEPVCDIVLKIADSMTPELANCDMVSLFFGKTFVLSMTEGLKNFAEDKVSYGAEQKAMIIKAILNMFSGYCVAKGDETVSNAHVVSLVNAALHCVSSRVYRRIFDHQLPLTQKSEQLIGKNELFLVVCPKYVISYTKARRESMFTEAKHRVMKTATHVLPSLAPQLNQIPLHLLKSVHLLFELLLLIPAKIYNSQPNLIKDLLSIVRLNANDSTINKETKKLIQRIIALIYTLTTDENLCKIIRKSLIDADAIELFDNLSLTSSDKHVRFTCALISWTLSRENMADRKYSPQMIETFVHYLTECGGDPLQQCHGVPLDSMITTLSGLVENEDAQRELIKQDAVPVIVKCASETQFDVPTVQQPSLECLWTMVFTPDVFLKLTESPKFLAHLKMLLGTTTTTATTTEENAEGSSEELARVADGLLWKLEKEPALLAKQKLTKKIEYDIMISYQHKNRDICKKLYERLTSQNKFRVWFDQENLYGPIMTRMAEGIEKSEFVLVAMSEHYEKSRYCRSEATYAYKSKRCIIPLKFQCAFKATGWLGMTVGDLLYIDFSEERLFDAAYKELIEQIDRYKQPKESEPSESQSPEPEPSEEPQKPVQEEQVPLPHDEPPSSLPVVEPRGLSICRRILGLVNRRMNFGKSTKIDVLHSSNLATSSMSPIENLTNDNSQKRPSTAREILAKKQMKNWTCDDIKDFVNEHQFEKFTKILVEANGNDLFRLYSMSQDNNNKLLDYMKQENPEISLSNYLRFMRIVEGYATQANTNG